MIIFISTLPNTIFPTLLFATGVNQKKCNFFSEIFTIISKNNLFVFL